MNDSDLPNVNPPPPGDSLAELGGLSPKDLFAEGLHTPAATGKWTPPTVEHVAKLLPQYRVEALIGHGGMGAVYKGAQPKLDRMIAIKLLPAELAGDIEFVARFEREARTLAKLHHPHIVSIHDFGQTSEGHLYFVMEFVNGTDLARIIAAGTLDAARALQLTIQICDALNYAHSQHVIHRDIKPANVLVTQDGQAKLADFGLARPGDEQDLALTASHLVMGTPDYMAPEQRAGLGDHRVDIYALGVMLYEMLTGQRPRGVFDPPSMKVQVDVRLDEVVIKAMREEPERRYQQASEMRVDVDRIQSTPQPKVAPKAAPQAAAKPVTKSVKVRRAKPDVRAWMIPLAVVALMAIAAIVAEESGWFKSPTTLGEVPPKMDTPKVASSATATKDQPFVNSLSMKFVPVPITGGPTKGQRVLFSVWDTRVQDYEAFVKETNREWPKTDFTQGPTHPAVMVSWDDAQLFCQWLTTAERKAGKISSSERYRLPSDYEWSCAAGIGDLEDAEKLPTEKNGKIKDVFPWGTQWPPPQGAGNYAGEEMRPAIAAGKYPYIKDALQGYNDGFVNTSPVGSFTVNRFGLFDIGGNVQQWCEDWFNKDQKSRVLRGASWDFGSRDNLLSSRHNNYGPELRHQRHGFRCVLASNDSAPSTGATSTAASPAAASSNTTTQETPFVNSLGMKFVPVPITGGPTGGQRVLFSVWDARVQDYEAFIYETKRDWLKMDENGQGPLHPALHITWHEAKAFCEWLTLRERKAGKLGVNEAYRLPSDHEWSCAVGIGDREDAAQTPEAKSQKITDEFPWGQQWPPPDTGGNYWSEEFRPLVATEGFKWFKGELPGRHDGYATTSPVGSYPANRHGLYEMGGNVWQWCEDWYNDEHKARVLRGGSFLDSERGVLLSSRRGSYPPDGRNYNTAGIRCVLAADSSAPAAAATKEAPFVNSLGMKFVPVPGAQGLFSIWHTRVKDYAAYAKAKTVDDSWARPQKDGVPLNQEPEHPVVSVSWDDAKAFCQWLTEKETMEGKIAKGARYRLPTDEEWSRAAGLKEDGTTPKERSSKSQYYPWGANFPPPRAKVGNYADTSFHGRFPSLPFIEGYADDYATTSPVGSFAPNELGLYDMGGNAWQWCEDLVEPGSSHRVMRGGAWDSYFPAVLLSSHRLHNLPDVHVVTYGFRCVLVPAAAE